MAGIAVVIIALGLWYYRSQALIITDAVKRQLQSVVELQAREIAHWRSERLGDARFYQNNRSFLKLAKARLTVDLPSASGELESWIRDTQASHGYEILLLDPNGGVRLASPTGIPLLANAELAAIQAQPMATAPHWVDFYRVEGSDAIRLTLIIPLRDPDVPDQSTGLMLWRINPARQLYPALEKWPVPSETGELALVQQRGDDMVYLAPLRFDPAAALNRKVSMRHVDRPGVQAALGTEGVMEGINYRSHRVLAAMVQIPDTPWALLARIDHDEAFRALHELRRTTALGIGALLLATLATAGYLWRQIEHRHVRQLQEANALLQESEKRLAALLAASPTILYNLHWDESGPSTVYVSANIERILGYTVEEALRPGWWQEHLHPEDRALAVGNQPRLGREDQLSHDYRLLHKDGHALSVYDQLRTVRDASGRLIEIVGALTDITHEKSRLEELRLKSAALEAAANAIVITSIDGTIEWANAAFTKLTGYTLGEVIHRNPRAIVKSGIQSEDFYRELWDTILQGRIWSGELVNRRKDGTH